MTQPNIYLRTYLAQCMHARDDAGGYALRLACQCLTASYFPCSFDWSINYWADGTRYRISLPTCWTHLWRNGRVGKRRRPDCDIASVAIDLLSIHTGKEMWSASRTMHYLTVYQRRLRKSVHATMVNIQRQGYSHYLESDVRNSVVSACDICGHRVSGLLQNVNGSIICDTSTDSPCRREAELSRSTKRRRKLERESWLNAKTKLDAVRQLLRRDRKAHSSEEQESKLVTSSPR